MVEWLGMIKDVGFPIVVTLYLLYRIEGKLDELNTSIQQLPGHLITGGLPFVPDHQLPKKESP
jgi:hypothetical protein